jgi:hypothetical protein
MPTHFVDGIGYFLVFFILFAPVFLLGAYFIAKLFNPPPTGPMELRNPPEEGPQKQPSESRREPRRSA